MFRVFLFFFLNLSCPDCHRSVCVRTFKRELKPAPFFFKFIFSNKTLKCVSDGEEVEERQKMKNKYLNLKRRFDKETEIKKKKGKCGEK